MKKAIMLFLVPIFLSACCGGDDPERVGFLTVSMNNKDGGYEIWTCGEDAHVMAGGDELEETFDLPADKAPGTCYQVKFDFVEGFITPEIKSYQVVADEQEFADKGEYVSSEVSEQISVSCNIPEGEYDIYRCSNDAHAGGGRGDSWKSFALPANPEDPGACYKIYCDDVPGYDTPDPMTVYMVAGQPQTAVCEYTE